jgi:hypothetical protein
MSYIVQIWEQPVPATEQEAETILDRLLDQPAGEPSRKMDELLKMLWARYPRDLVTDRADPVWADTFPKDGREHTPVETLAVMTPYLDEVILVITAATAALGLVAYDPQLGTVYLPGGRTLGAPPPTPPGTAGRAGAPTAPPREFLDKPAAFDRFVDKASAVFGAHGFRWKKIPMGNVFLRTFPGGQQIIAPVVTTRHEGSPGLSLLLMSNLFAVDEHVHRLREPRKPKPTEVLSGELDGWLQARGDKRAALYKGGVGERGIPVNTPAKVDAAVVALEGILPELVADCRVFETLEDLWGAAVEAAQGRRTPHLTESLDAKLIAGKLLGATGLEEVLEDDARRYEADLERRRKAHPDPDTQAMLARAQDHAALRRKALLEFVQRGLKAS